MNNYRRKCILIIIAELLVAVIAVLFISGVTDAGLKHAYRVQIKRAADMIYEASSVSANADGKVDLDNLDLSQFNLIKGVRVFNPSESPRYQYEVVEVNGTLYQIEYVVNDTLETTVICIITFGVVILLNVFMMMYIGRNIVRPFNRFKDLPIELSRGNLTVPLNENKNKFFGKYLWGMNLLRENLEQSKEAELEFQREKKTLILSLAHDIKTPLSSVKLYSKALSEGLYDTEDKKQKAYEGIQSNAVEIEGYIGQIMNTANDDFLNLTVENGEYYFSELMQRITVYYSDKLKNLHTVFEIAEYDNCLCRGDLERTVEVFQNVIENAIKYGDGEFIKISCSEEENCRLVSVTNSGNPPPSEEILHLFDSFYRGSNSKGKKGNGLGLYICRKLMRMMDGDIFADTSEANLADAASAAAADSSAAAGLGDLAASSAVSPVSVAPASGDLAASASLDGASDLADAAAMSARSDCSKTMTFTVVIRQA